MNKIGLETRQLLWYRMAKSGYRYKVKKIGIVCKMWLGDSEYNSHMPACVCCLHNWAVPVMPVSSRYPEYTQKIDRHRYQS